jgi:hypothetical protein
MAYLVSCQSNPNSVLNFGSSFIKICEFGHNLPSQSTSQPTHTGAFMLASPTSTLSRNNYIFASNNSSNNTHHSHSHSQTTIKGTITEFSLFFQPAIPLPEPYRWKPPPKKAKALKTTTATIPGSPQSGRSSPSASTTPQSSLKSTKKKLKTLSICSKMPGYHTFSPTPTELLNSHADTAMWINSPC